ncbi:hypothetical protein KUV23_06065 [Algoriphagus marincola]|uniref:Uncharacterized protein n=1 Tax=Algoriphagus marincola TaxID=264027 RepID=A0ABS7N2J0_9BACT|nr:hypothetical protein [Algoriphagus marincola]MBY5950529.1 hypothetical protein [Algoriphagus marincola]
MKAISTFPNHLENHIDLLFTGSIQEKNLELISDDFPHWIDTLSYEVIERDRMHYMDSMITSFKSFIKEWNLPDSSRNFTLFQIGELQRSFGVE